ncbi:hypothetical protein [Glaciimonas sp. PCH181]|uniref:hypothetical protein n=1 Tax=Glaciimonas sp. PCH181 TaxID=2133943 RepID=UPI000D357B95|nr:hypothetical protein [Glaciimonas sp. PCH181]PUA18708.1 hypothetical protein C7W93_01910 [Glaciimonas sp. PCH181]
MQHHESRAALTVYTFFISKNWLGMIVRGEKWPLTRIPLHPDQISDEGLFRSECQLNTNFNRDIQTLSKLAAGQAAMRHVINAMGN